MADDWRILEVLKLLRQCVVCPFCGVLVATEEGLQAHTNWHNAINTEVSNIDTQFQAIDTYVRGDGGLETQIVDAFAEKEIEIAQIRADATQALADKEAEIVQLRNDATTAINQLRTDATNAIAGLTARITALGG